MIKNKEKFLKSTKTEVDVGALFCRANDVDAPEFWCYLGMEQNGVIWLVRADQYWNKTVREVSF